MSSPAKLTFFHQKQNFFPKIFGGSGFSSYLCPRFTDDSSLSGRATVSPMASGRRLFLCLMGKNIFPQLGKYIFLTGEIILAINGGCMNRRFDKSFRISHHL